MAKNNDLDEFGFEPLENSTDDIAELSEFGFEPIEEVNTEDYELPSSDISTSESLGRGAIQGATLGFGEELGAATLTPIEALRRKISSLIEGTPENVDEKLREQGFNLPEEKGVYQELRDTARQADKEASEANPMAYLGGEIVGGIAPAIVSGGAASAAKTASALVKGGLKQAVKEGAKTGAKYGATSGLGYSEGEDIGELVTDTASGALMGAGTGALLPIAIEGAKGAASKVGKGVKKTLDFLPGAEDIKAGYAYGKQGKKITEEVVDAEVKNISRRVLDNIKTAKSNNNMKEAKKLLEDMGFKVNTKKAINEAIEDLQKIDADDILGVQNKELLPKLQQLAGRNLQEEKLVEQASKSAIKKQATAQTEADKLLSGDKMPNAQIYKTVDEAGRPIIQTVDEGLGRVTTLVGNIEKKMQRDLSKMSIDEVESLRKQLNVMTNLAKVQGAADDPVMSRAKQLAAELKELTDKAIVAVGDDDLIQRRAKFSDIFAAEELLGINKRLAARTDINEELLENTLGGRLAFSKGFKSRQEEDIAKSLLGEDIISGADSRQLDLLKQINKIMGREEYADNISRAGLYKKATADVPNLAGRAVRNVQEFISPVKEASSAVMNMPKEQLAQFASKLQSSEKAGLKSLGNRLAEATSKEGTAQHQAIWALSQTPAFRELIRRNTDESNKEFDSLIQDDSELNMSVLEPSQEAPVSMERTPDSSLSDKLGQRESSNNYQAVNRLGYLGKYQFGGMALQDLGYKDAQGNWTGKDGIESKEDFLSNPDVQEKAFTEWEPMVKRYNKSKGLDRYIGQDFQGITVTEDGLAAAAHLIGSKGLKKMFDTGEIPEDANGTKATEYLQMFQDSAQSEIEPEVEADPEEVQEVQNEVEREIDRVNTQQGSGENTPLGQLDSLLEKINKLKASPEQIDDIENEAIQMESFADGQRLKEKIRRLQGLS